MKRIIITILFLFIYNQSFADVTAVSFQQNGISINSDTTNTTTTIITTIPTTTSTSIVPYIPHITRINPVYVYIGEDTRLEIGLSDTSFYNAQLSAEFSGSGITVVSVQENIHSLDSIFVDIIVDPNAEFGFRDITIQINSETTSQSNAIYLVGKGCSPAYPVLCQEINACCPADYPYCGLGLDRHCYSQPPKSICAAEAALGEDEESLSILRSFRDNVLLKSEEGKKYVALYYKYSPAIVTLMEKNPELKQQVKTSIMAIIPMIKKYLQKGRSVK